MSKYLEITLETFDTSRYTLVILMTNIEHMPMWRASWSERKGRIAELQAKSDFSPALLQPNCLRCGGLTVNEVSMDLMNSTSELESGTRGGVQCGDILRLRHLAESPHSSRADDGSA